MPLILILGIILVLFIVGLVIMKKILFSTPVKLFVLIMVVIIIYNIIT